MDFTFRFSSPNEPVLAVELPDQQGTRLIAPWRQCEATVLIRNQSSYSARNPAIRIDLIGMGGIGGSTGWMPTAFVNTIGPTAVRREGGADYAIHGNWTRELPLLDFAGVRVHAMSSAALRVELVADGFRRQRDPDTGSPARAGRVFDVYERAGRQRETNE